MTDQHGFTLEREERIDELNATAQIWRHAKTGAELLSIINDDENKGFGITFRTPPSDSTGVPHIMEHSVLGGSRKYRTKEPFVDLLKGSLHTFLNAMTYPDKTTYPVASQNLQDFYNLVDVYLDAVFYPLIPPTTLQQEGWHYELENADDPLTFKGVVFNEMKGAYSSPDSVLYRSSQRSLFPDTTYGVDSGGDPEQIPNLTYEQFKGFHDTFYHPSNARIYFYGDDAPEERLRILNEYLKDFERIEPNSNVALQQPFAAPKRLVETYDVGEDGDTGKKAMVTVNWMLTEANDPQTNLALGILEYILVGTAASPLRKALIDSGLGEDVAGVGLGDGMLQTYFSTGLKGIALEDVDTVEQLVVETLRGLAENGIDADTVAAAINTVEFQLRENNTGSFPRGLSLMLRSLSTWLYGGDPLAPLRFEAPLGAIKGAVERGEKPFEDMIRRFFLQNNHRTTLVMQPDPALAKRKEEDERRRLDEARAAMSSADLETVVAETKRLRALQEAPDSPEALASIPALKREDLDKQNKTIPLAVGEYAGAKLLTHDLFTNGILYLDLAMDLHVLPTDLLPYAGLFGRVLLEMGTEQEDFVKLAQRIGRDTGGIRPSALVSAAGSASEAVAYLVLRAKTTQEQTGALLEIVRDVLLHGKLDDKERFKQIVLEEKSNEEAGLVPSGHIVVKTRLSANFSLADWVSEQIGGLEYLFFTRQLLERIESDWGGVLADLGRVRELLVNRNALLVNVTLDDAGYKGVEPQINALIDQLPEAKVAKANWRHTSGERGEGLTIPAQVNYVGKGANLYELGYEYHGSAAVIAKYLRTTWLWEKIRVQGGAYGGFCTFDRLSGVFNFLSYRDPNLMGTLGNYDGTARFLREADLNDDEVTKSVVGAIGDMDQYQLPDAKGYTAMVRYLVGDSDEKRQRIRDEVLSTGVANFRAFADVLTKVNEAGRVTVLGSAPAIEAANKELDDLLVVTKIL